MDVQEISGSSRKMLAFVHIEKAAGTTLIHILRSNYFLQYCDVRPLSKDSERVFGAHDLKKYLYLNPFLKCLAGHAVVPYGSLVDNYPEVQFITVLREPVKRYVSQFQYLTQEMSHKFSFREFLDDEHYVDFQTRKIVQSRDLEQAKKVLSEKFLLVGIVEEFDEFLAMLKRKLIGTRFDPRYRLKNTARDKKVGADILERYHDEIAERNRTDLALYDFVKNEVLPSNRAWYGESLETDVEHLRGQRAISPMTYLKSGFDYAVRKAYIEPATNIIRCFSGLPAKGSY